VLAEPALGYMRLHIDVEATQTLSVVSRWSQSNNGKLDCPESTGFQATLKCCTPHHYTMREHTVRGGSSPTLEYGIQRFVLAVDNGDEFRSRCECIRGSEFVENLVIVDSKLQFSSESRGKNIGELLEVCLR